MVEEVERAHTSRVNRTSTAELLLPLTTSLPPCVYHCDGGASYVPVPSPPIRTPRLLSLSPRRQLIPDVPLSRLPPQATQPPLPRLTPPKDRPQSHAEITRDVRGGGEDRADETAERGGDVGRGVGVGLGAEERGQGRACQGGQVEGWEPALYGGNYQAGARGELRFLRAVLEEWS